MKTKLIRALSLTLGLAAGVFTSSSSLAQAAKTHHQTATAAKAGTLAPADAKTGAAWLAEAIAAYSVDGCVVSDDKFDGGPMGKPKAFVYKTTGQPDRLVRLCCKDCVKAFNEDPAKAIKALDTAAAAKAKAPAKK